MWIRFIDQYRAKVYNKNTEHNTNKKLMKNQIFKGVEPHIGTEDAGKYILKKRKKIDLLKLKRISKRARELEEKYQYEDFRSMREL